MTPVRLTLPGFTICPLLAALALGCASSDTRTTVPDPGGDGAASDGSGDGFVGSDGSLGADGSGADGSGGGGKLGCDKMDIVFVVDNSGSMGEEQDGLTANFPQMVEVLNAFKGGSLDYRLAVTTTAFSDELLEAFGLDDAAEGAFLPPNGISDRKYLVKSDSDLAARFTDLASVGTSGSGQEQPLQAALSSITEREMDGSNAGFRRDDALLAFVIITDEDDDSGEPGPSPIPFLPGPTVHTPVDEIISGLDAATGDRSQWAAAVIAGQTDCESNFGEANEATRLKDFVGKTGENAAFGDICTGDLSGSLKTALDTFTIACNDFVVF